MAWRERLKNRKTITALLAAGVLLSGGSLAIVAPGTEIICLLVGCV